MSTYCVILWPHAASHSWEMHWEHVMSPNVFCNETWGHNLYFDITCVHIFRAQHFLWWFLSQKCVSEKNTFLWYKRPQKCFWCDYVNTTYLKISSKLSTLMWKIPIPIPCSILNISALEYSLYVNILRHFVTTCCFPQLRNALRTCYEPKRFLQWNLRS